MFNQEKQLLVEYRECLKRLKTEKDNHKRFFLYNYIGNLLFAINASGYREKYDKRAVFGDLEHYRKFQKRYKFLKERFIDNFIFYKDFHADYLNDILVDTECDFFSTINNIKKKKKVSNLTRNEFLDIFVAFTETLGLRSLFLEILDGKHIHNIQNKKSKNEFLGQTLYDSITGETNILITNFSYNIDSMFTLAHEFGHYYGLSEFIPEVDLKKYSDYFFKSLYPEVISILFEKLFLDFLIENDIQENTTQNILVDSLIDRHSTLFSTYILSLLKDTYLEKEGYLYMSDEDIFKEVKKYFMSSEELFEMINGSELNLFDDILYTYGDIISLFLKDDVKKDGLTCNSLLKFMEQRTEEFTSDFIISSSYTPKRYSELYKKQLQLVKK